MDYETMPTSRKELRVLSKFFRQIFGLSLSDPIDPVKLLDYLSVHPKSNIVNYEVLEDGVLPYNVPAQCMLLDDGKFILQISERVYEGAQRKRIGGYRMHIMHEIAHAFAYQVGFVPTFNRQPSNRTIPSYKSIEWIAKALAGEIMIPYEESMDMSQDEIVEKYGVSYLAANTRLKH